MADESQPPEKNFFRRIEDFSFEYANNIQFETNAFDLKLVFGQLDHSTSQVEQHTAITVSWLQSKLMLYYLTLNVAGYELQYGKISIPPDVMPANVPPLTPEQEKDPRYVKLYDLFRRLREQFVKENP